MARNTLFESNGAHSDQNTFSFERLRLSFGGHVLSPDVQYFLQLDGNSDQSGTASFLGYFVTYDLGEEAGIHCPLVARCGRLGHTRQLPH